MQLIPIDRVPRPPVVDAVVAVILAVAGEVAIWTGATDEGPRAATTVTALLLTLPLAWRRAAPAPATGVFIVGVLMQSVLGDSPHSIWALAALLLTAFSAGAGLPRRQVVWLGSLLVASMWVTILVQPDAEPGDKLFTAPLLAGGPLLVGIALRRQTARVEEMARLAVQLERDREESARLAVASERARIAGEMHDVVAHGVSVMVVQAGAAEGLMEVDPDRARHALGAVRDAGKQSLDELRRLLGVIRADGVVSGLAPQPDMSAVPGLVETMRATGLSVELETSGSPREVGAGLGLVVYRLIQESLTNVGKHAPGATVHVAIEWQPRRLRVAVCDEGRAQGWVGAGDGTGHGLIGMRERVGLYDGTFQAGAVPGGGWQVEASLPLADRLAQVNR